MASNPRTLRLWPGIALASLLALVRFGMPLVTADETANAVIGGLAGGLLIGLWWLLFSKAPWSERLGAIGITVIAIFLTSRIADPSIGKGAMGMLLPILAAPAIALAFVAWAYLTRNLENTRVRWASMAATIAVSCGVFALIKTGGFTGGFENDLMWRWTPSPEERLLAASPLPVPEPAPVPAKAVEPVAKEVPKTIPEPAVEAAVVPEPEWPSFRGPLRDGSAPGLRIETAWSANPPQLMWKQPVGPGWSSFAIAGDLFYTQEQRGEDELVSCYRVSTGKSVWVHKDKARFWESNAGAGPRGTPTLAGGRVYTFGGTGIVNALDAATGALLWTRDAAADAGMKTPDWGFASSPLVVGSKAIVAVSGRLVAYDASSGKPLWMGPEGGGTSYSSPRLTNAGGAAQVLLLQKPGIVSLNPENGKKLWDYTWEGYPIVQPALLPDGDIVMSVDDSGGIRRISAGAKAEQRWASAGLKPYYNDFVVHKGHAYGFDRSILSCVDLQDGKRKWKGGRYGFGQLILLPGQDLLLVLSEEGELALVQASPEGFTEVAAKVPALEGKTWNHPAVASGVLLVRNAQEMAAFRLKLIN